MTRSTFQNVHSCFRLVCWEQRTEIGIGQIQKGGIRDYREAVTKTYCSCINFLGSHKKAPQTGQLKSETSFHSSRGSKSKSAVQQSYSLMPPEKVILASSSFFCFPAVLRVPWPVDAPLQLCGCVFLLSSLHGACCCVCISPLMKDSSHVGLGPF